MAVKILLIPEAVWRMSSSRREERRAKNEFFKLCLLGFKVFIMSPCNLKFARLFRYNITINSITKLMEFLFQLLNTRGVRSKKVSAGFSKILSNITCADLSKMSETTFPIWILETVKQFCKWFFSLDLKQVSFFHGYP